MTAETPAAKREIEAGSRFGFGANWSDFLSVVDEQRVDASVASLTALLPASRIEGHTFLDVGCGSGLSSLAAQRLGAARVCSFDFDDQSVASTRELKRRLAPDSADWTVMQGSILDDECVTQLGAWDVVYSWGVLHHTGRMWYALANASKLVRPGGTLFIAIYNDQGAGSRFWARVKRIYN
ncbi:MAG: methyltransferase, partial [Gemmatimonadaceae bacterium]